MGLKWNARSLRETSVCSPSRQAGAGKRSMAAPSAHMQDFFKIPCVSGRLKCFLYYIGLSGLPVIWLRWYQALQMAEVQWGSNRMHLCAWDQDRSPATERFGSSRPAMLTVPPPWAPSDRSELPHPTTSLCCIVLHTERVNHVGKKRSILFILTSHRLSGGLWPDPVNVIVTQH